MVARASGGVAHLVEHGERNVGAIRAEADHDVDPGNAILPHQPTCTPARSPFGLRGKADWKASSGELRGPKGQGQGPAGEVL